MLARSRVIRHPSETTIETPILVPSFSSKGFKMNKKGISEVFAAFKTTSEVLTDSMLISAYDLHYKHIPVKNYPTEIVFIDSGGYETSDDNDLSAVQRHTGKINKWNEDLLINVLDGLPGQISAIIVNYDHGSLRRPMAAQIDSANNLFKRYPQHLHDFLIKPETLDKQLLTIPVIIENITDLQSFDIIGVTEKELGDSLLARMTNIAKIRIAMDENGIDRPLHVFGSLDPISSTLYFLAGAEIFDGLTWLRYSYFNGLTIYNRNYGALECGIRETDNLIISRTLFNNIYFLRDLYHEMKDFLGKNEFDRFSQHSDFLEKSFSTFYAEIRR